LEKFGKFQLLERIGAGGMAEIFLARPSDAELSKLVAVKRILPEQRGNTQFQDMFRREGEIALRFRHPSIVTVYEVGSVKDVNYISMEFFPGKTLAQIIIRLRENNNALEVSDKIYIIKCIAEALNYIHEFTDHGEATEIIHRDISPQNILVGFDGETKLIDFGVAKVNNVEEGTTSKDLKGKIAYMSPEQVRGGELTKQTDIFSLGIVLWEVLAGRKLFPGKSAAEVTARVEACQIPSLIEHAPEVPVDLRLVCQEALARDVKDRYQSAGKFAADLDDVLRTYPRERNQKSIAKVLNELFPEDVKHLKAQLKKYEFSNGLPDANSGADLYDAKTVIEFEKPAMQRPQSLPNENRSANDNREQRKKPLTNSPPQFIAAPRPIQHQQQQPSLPPPPSRIQEDESMIHSTRSSVKPAIGFKTASIVVVAVAFVIFLAQLKSAKNSVVDSETHFDEVLNITAPLQLPPQMPTQPQPSTQQPSPQRNSHQVSAPLPAAVTLSSDPIVFATPVQVRPRLNVQQGSAQPAPVKTLLPQKPRAVVQLDSSPRPQTSAPVKVKPIKRKVAAVAPVKAFAYLTVLADPDAVIYVDGAVVGTEVANNIRVPADRKVVIKVVPKAGDLGAKIQTQTLQFKAYSRNVIEVSVSAAKRTRGNLFHRIEVVRTSPSAVLVGCDAILGGA
jgi:serine/threonine protein kinase